MRLEDRLVDLVAEAVARETEERRCSSRHAPRAVVDLNRAPDDVDWDMVVGGRGRPPLCAMGPAAVRVAGSASYRGGCPASASCGAAA